MPLDNDNEGGIYNGIIGWTHTKSLATTIRTQTDKHNHSNINKPSTNSIYKPLNDNNILGPQIMEDSTGTIRQPNATTNQRHISRHFNRQSNSEIISSVRRTTLKENKGQKDIIMLDNDNDGDYYNGNINDDEIIMTHDAVV